MATKGYRSSSPHAHKDVEDASAWPVQEDEKQGLLGTVDSCEQHVRAGFLRKVFGIVAAQLAVTSVVCAIMMLNDAARGFALGTPSMLIVSFICSMGFLFAAHKNKDEHPKNLYYTLGFTLSMAWSVGAVCARFYASGLGLIVLEAVGLTASVTVALTVYALKSKKDFSYMGAGLGSALWVLIIGGLMASLVGSDAMHFAMSIGGAGLFSLYIIYDVHMISKRLGPDEYVPAAISLYLDIINLFLYILEILARLQSRD